MLSKEVDACVTGLLKELVRFQDRMYQKDPVKAKTKRRLVLGLREVLKHLKLRKLKCIIISPNCEKTQSKGDSPAAPTAHVLSCQCPVICPAVSRAHGQCAPWQLAFSFNREVTLVCYQLSPT